MILIPARNEGPRIGAVIRSARMAQPGVEIVVIANDCIDDTVQVAARAGATEADDMSSPASASRRHVSHFIFH